MTTEFQKAFSLHQQGRMKEAIEAYRHIESEDPGRINELLGIAHAQLQSYDKALSYFKKAATLQPDLLSIKSNMATCYKKMGQYKQAITLYQDILKHNPFQCVVLNNLASLYITQHEAKKAIELLKKAICLQPNYADAYYNLALASQDYRYCKTASTLGHQLASYQYALYQESQGALSSAKQYYQASLSQDDHHALSHHGLARVLLALDDDEQALLHFIRAQKIDPYIPNLMENIGAYYHVKGMHANAIEYWVKALSLTENKTEIHYNIGVAYHYMNRHQDALEYFQMVLEDAPHHTKAHTNIAAIALQNNQTKTAISHYQTVLKYEPNNEEVQYILSALTQAQHDFQHSPKQYVTNLFDQYAGHYEKHLLSMLKYQLPHKTELILHEHLTQKAHYTICDLGCGTGLLGQTLKPFAKTLIGVDLSTNMLQKAKEKHCYDQLVEADCVAYLDNQVLDVIIALELCPYIGDLTPLFTKIKQALSPDGLFIFSIESTPKAPYHLSQHARYQHNPISVQTQLEALGFQILEKEPTTLRTQNNQPVSGCLFVIKMAN